MSTQAIEWLDVGTLEDIPTRGARRVHHSGANIALFRTATDEVFALEDRCPHSSGPLSQGIVHDDCVTCPLHNWIISLRDGSVQGVDEGQTRSFPVRMQEKRLQLGIPD
jgi:nitrite reductase (NADH) small subunit